MSGSFAVSTVNTVLTTTGKSRAYILENFALPILAFKIQFSSTCEQLLFELQATVCTVGTLWFVMHGDAFYTVIDWFIHLYALQSTGSCGNVCKAMFDQLPCSIKLLHPALFQFNDPHSQVIIQQFEKECEFLSEIRHPQYGAIPWYGL